MPPARLVDPAQPGRGECSITRQRPLLPFVRKRLLEGGTEDLDLKQHQEAGEGTGWAGNVFCPFSAVGWLDRAVNPIAHISVSS